MYVDDIPKILSLQNLAITCLMSSIDLSICFNWVYCWWIWKWISYM